MKMTDFFDGQKMCEVVVCHTLRKLKPLDLLLCQWESVFLQTYKLTHSEYTLSDVYYSFFEMILLDEIDMKVRNSIIYFMKNEIVRVQLNENSQILTTEWEHIFESKVEIDKKTDNYDYVNCKYNDTIDKCFPRFELCARYMCLSIRQTVKQNKETDTYTFQTFNDTYYSFYITATRMLNHKALHESGAKLLKILAENIIDLYIFWNVNEVVYPGHKK